MPENPACAMGHAGKKSTRLFVGLKVGAGPAAKLANLPIIGGNFRPVPLANMHVTIRFLGERDSSALDAIATALEAVSLPAFTLHAGKAGYFLRKQQAVLWTGLEPSAELADLARQVDGALLARAGILPDRKKWTPHISLGRMRQADRRDLDRFVNEAGPWTGVEWPAVSFHLFKSDLGPLGAVYTSLREYPLAGGDAA